MDAVAVVLVVMGVVTLFGTGWILGFVTGVRRVEREVALREKEAERKVVEKCQKRRRDV